MTTSLLHEKPSIAEFFRLMRDYFAGFISQDELEPALRALEATDEDIPKRKELFEDALGDLLHPVPTKNAPWHLLAPHRRRFFFDYDQIAPLARLRDLSLFRFKNAPDNSFAIPKGRGIYDVRFLEEVGFVRYQGAMISRTVQPVLLYKREALNAPEPSAKHVQGVTEAVVVMIPNLSDKDFVQRFPSLLTINRDGVGFSGEFVVVDLKPEVKQALGLPKHVKALAAVAYKSKFKPIKSRSKKSIDRTYAEGLVL